MWDNTICKPILFHKMLNLWGIYFYFDGIYFLFVYYLLEVDYLEEAGCDGMILAGIVVILLLYADDIVLLARCPSDLDKQLKFLKKILLYHGYDC